MACYAMLCDALGPTLGHILASTHRRNGIVLTISDAVRIKLLDCQRIAVLSVVLSAECLGKRNIQYVSIRYSRYTVLG